MNIRRVSALGACLAGVLFSAIAMAGPIRVGVGAYDFPPFVSWRAGQAEGVVVGLLDLFNKQQTRYRFELVETSSKRRYQDLKDGRYDVILFENIQWGWDPGQVTASDVFMVGGEVFIARAAPHRDQSFFADLRTKSIRGILGYHYGFAGFRTDDSSLSAWKLELTNSHVGNIQAVIDGRCELAIVTKEYLDIHLKENPAQRPLLLVSDKMDQQYNHTVLVGRSAGIKVAAINELLKQIRENGALKRLVVGLGLKGTLPNAH